MKRYAACIAAVLLIASAGAALGQDTINGKPLNDVHDIVRETNAGTAIVPKASIMKLKQVRDFLNIALLTAPVDQYHKGAHTEKKDIYATNDLYDRDHYMGITAAASTRPITGGAKRRVVIGDLGYGGGGGIKTFLTEPKDDVSFRLSGDVRSLPISFKGWRGWDTKLVFTDIRGGLFIDGEPDESFVAGILNDRVRLYTFNGGNTGGDYPPADVIFLVLDGRKLNDESFTGDPAAYKNASAEISDAQFPVMRVVAGDFDGDGIASEIAWIATPINDPYRFTICKVHRSSSGEVYLEDLYKGSPGSINVGFLYGHQRDTEPGCDIVAGDFDGDGRTEIAFVAISAAGHDLKPLVQTYKYVDGEFKSSWQNFSSGFPDICNTIVPGVLAAAGDFDGNGADEVAFVTASDPSSVHMATVAFDAVAGGAPKPVLKQHKTVDGSTVSRKYTPLASVASLATGPTYAAAGDGGLFDEIYMTLLRSDGKTAIYHLDDPLSALEAKEISVTDDASTTSLVLSDLAGESLVLGDPDHIITEDARSYSTMIPAVPYHIDYIRSDWRDPNPTPAPRALQLITPPTSVVKYSKTETESEKEDTSFETRSHFDWSAGGGVNIKFPVKMVGFKLEAKGGYKKATDDIDKELDSETTSKTTKIDAAVQDNDVVSYYTGTLHAWRYPIIGAHADDADLIDEMFSDENGAGDVPKNDPLKNVPIDSADQKYYTVMRLADVTNAYSGATAGDRYQPDYDESSLFSYPNDLRHIKAYATRQTSLSDADRFSTNVSATKTIAFDSIISETDSEVDTTSSGGSLSITGGIAIPPGKKSIFAVQAEAAGSKSTTISNGSTFTSTTKASTSYSVSVTADRNAADSLFDVLHAAYVDAGGITTLAFAVDLRPGIDPARAWEDTGPYGTSPDPSLVLPDRVFVGSTRLDSGTIVPVAKAETRPLAATRLRGVRLFDRTVGEDPSVGTSYTVSTLVRGREYAIVVPVYNASFKDTGEFKVQIGCTTSDHLKQIMTGARGVPAADDGEIELLKEISMDLSGWTHNSDEHRGAVSFDWTLPADMQKGNYELCVRIAGRDGDIHRDWNIDEGSDGYDPCGNDWGHFSFAVIDEEDLDESEIIEYVTDKKDGIRGAQSSSEPKVELTFKVDGQEPMKFDELRRWLVGRTDPVDLQIDITNTGERSVLGANVMIYELLEDGRMRTLLDRDLTSLFPGSSISRHFTIDPQKFLTRDLRAKISGFNISQTLSEPTAASSSSGCAAGAACSAAIAMMAAATRRKK